jgi:sugar lactone lactonase YvrE
MIMSLELTRNIFRAPVVRTALALGIAALLAGCSQDPPVDEPTGPSCEPSSGTICTVVGVDYAGFAGDGGPAYEAALYLPQDVTFGPDGLLYTTDWNNHRIRRVLTDGNIETFAGTGLLGDGPPGPAMEADFNHPTTLEFTPDGVMLISAWHNSRIKAVDLETGNLIDSCGTGARAYTGDGGPAKDAALDLPAGIALDTAGNLYINDQANQVIRRVTPDGVIERFAGVCIVNECADGDEILPCEGSDKFACGEATPMVCGTPCKPAYGGDDGPALEARFSAPFGQAADPAGHLAFDAEGNLYIADTGNHRIRRITTDGMIETVAGSGTPGFSGDGGPATSAELNRPVDIAFDAEGNLYIADTYNSCVRVVKGGTIETFAGQCGVRGFDGDGGPPTEAKLDRPYGIGLNAQGDVFVVDTYNHRIRVVSK